MKAENNKKENKEETVKENIFRESVLVICGSLSALAEKANELKLMVKEVYLSNGSFSGLCESLGGELDGTVLKVTQMPDQFASVAEINKYEGVIEKMIILGGNGKAFLSRHNIEKFNEIEKKIMKEKQDALNKEEKEERMKKLKEIEAQEKLLKNEKAKLN